MEITSDKPLHGVILPVSKTDSNSAGVMYGPHMEGTTKLLALQAKLDAAKIPYAVLTENIRGYSMSDPNAPVKITPLPAGVSINSDAFEHFKEMVGIICIPDILKTFSFERSRGTGPITYEGGKVEQIVSVLDRAGMVYERTGEKITISDAPSIGAIALSGATFTGSEAELKRIGYSQSRA